MIYSRPVDHSRKAEWQLPFVFAFALHLLFILGSLYAPDIFQSKPKFAEVQTVNLVNIPSIPKKAGSPAPPLAKQIKAKKEKPKKSVQIKKEVPPKSPPKKLAPIAENTVQPIQEPNAPSKVISLNPKKRKIKKKLKPEPDAFAQQEKKRALAQQKREKEQARRQIKELARKLREEALLEKQATLAREKAQLAKKALEEERALLRSSAATAQNVNRNTSTTSSTRESSQPGMQGGSSAIENQYFAAIKTRLLNNWVLPPTMLNNPTLEATVVVTVNYDGKIIDMFFEKRSGERVFDQFVEKTVNDSDPFPPIPAAMRKQRIEIGFKFSPKGIQ